MVQSVEFLVEGRCRLRIHQIQMDVGQLYAMLTHQDDCRSPRFLLIDKGNKGVFSFFLIDFAQSFRKLFRLSCFKKSEQSLAVYSKKAVELRCRSLYVTAFRLYKLVNDITLIFFFRKDVIHLQEPPLAGDVLVDEGLFVLGKDIELALFVSDEGVDFGTLCIEIINNLLLFCLRRF